MSDEICQLKANFKPGAHKFFTQVGLRKPTQFFLGNWNKKFKGKLENSGGKLRYQAGT